MATTLKRISVENAKVGMVLGENVVSQSGHVLFSKNTILHDKSIAQLKMYRIEKVAIRVEAPTPIVPVSKPTNEFVSFQPLNFNSLTTKVPVKETKRFAVFEDSYKVQEKEAEKYFDVIKNGEQIEIGDLYSLTDEIIAKTKFKSDVFEFMYGVEAADTHTYSHCLNVSLICHVFGFWLGLKPESIVNLSIAGMLHDIGKTRIDPEIIAKPGKLTKIEFEEMKKHAYLGYKMIENSPFVYPIKMAVLMHHERMNGKGYPVGAMDKQINVYAKIVAIADIYDSMTSERPYRKKLCPFDVMDIMQKDSFGELDTKYLLIFLSNIADNYLGSLARLSNGDTGEVVFINKLDLSRPMVKVGEKVIDLSKDKSMKIEELL